jgi:putative transposase
MDLDNLLSGGSHQVRVTLRALTLPRLADGRTAPQSIRKIAHRDSAGGIALALYDRLRPGASGLLDGLEKQRIVAMVCSPPPEGQARWTVHLVMEQAVKRKLEQRIGRETIRVLRQSHDSKPLRQKNVVRTGIQRRIYIEDGRLAGVL